VNLNIQSLLRNLKDNRQAILEKIHNDPMLVKRACPVTGVYVANASKELFSPKELHQLYAKGLIYRKESDTAHALVCNNYKNGIASANHMCPDTYALYGMPYLKMFNWDESDAVRKHAGEMLAMGATPIFFEKLDGTLISRNVVDDRVILSTRGMLDTLPAFGDDEDAGNKFFNWAYKIIDEKYPNLRDPGYAADGTLLFELVGPENRIVTFYSEWDLVLTGVYSHDFNVYFTHDELRAFANAAGLTHAKFYEPQGDSILEQIQDLNRQLVSTDKEGTVIQFEKDGIVVGRIKAKSDTYRTLLRIAMNCKYDTIAELLDEHPELQTWEAMEAHLQELGRHNFPEELMDAYRNFFRQYQEHRARCQKFLDGVISNCDRIFQKIHVKDYTKGLNREQRKDFAIHAIKFSNPTAYFAFVDGKLDMEFVMKKVLKEPADSEKVNLPNVRL
jgi:hypothetical protein